MKRIILVLNLMLFLVVCSMAQQNEAAGTGIVDFLIGNPETANKKNVTELQALVVIGDLLKTPVDREHQLAYASESISQITLNTNRGRQAQFVKDENGNVYLIANARIYPVADQIVSQAKSLDKDYFENHPDNTPGTDVFSGLWVNTDSNTESISKFFIRKENDEYVIHMWGKCQPEDCYWGYINSPVQPKPAVKWDQGFREESLRFGLMDTGNVELYSLTHYTDDSGRHDFSLVEYYKHL